MWLRLWIVISGLVKDAAWLVATSFVVWVAWSAFSQGRYGEIGGFAAFYAVIFLLSFWVRERRFRRRCPANLEAVQVRFAGFAVGKRDFEKEGNALYRVNSDGLRVELTKWYFDENSGEFFHIENKIGKHFIYNSTPFSRRFVENAKPNLKKLGVVVVGVIAGGFSVPFGFLAYRDYITSNGNPDTLGFICAGLALLLAFTACKKLVLLIIDQDGVKIGPEALQRGAAAQFTAQQPHGMPSDEGII